MPSPTSHGAARRAAARVWPVVLIGLMVSATGAAGQSRQARPAPSSASRDPLIRARGFYNERNYDAAVASATEAGSLPDPASKAMAALLLGRARLERFRQAGNQVELTAARDALRSIDPAVLPPRDRTELAIGYALELYLEESYGAAAELFESLLDNVSQPADTSRERVLEWWATAMDRDAQQRDPVLRAPLYTSLADRMEAELGRTLGSPVAAYWLAAAARGTGDVDRAWNAAIAGWVRAPLAGPAAPTLRADLDKLVTEGIIPERVKRIPAQQRASAAEAMAGEWKRLKERWGS